MMEKLIITSSTLGQPSFYKSLKLAPQGEPGYDRTSQYIGAFNGVNSAGSAIGALACAYFADRLGRKVTIQISAAILIVGAAICTAAVDNAMFLVGRLINGLGIGGLVTTIPMVSAEIEDVRRSLLELPLISTRCPLLRSSG
jgi:MFS family permease